MTCHLFRVKRGENVKLFGMIVIFLSSVAFFFERSRALGRATALTEELYCFMKRARIEVGCYLKPLSEIRTSSPLLSGLGFFSCMEMHGIERAYLLIEDGLSLSEAEKGTLRGIFSSLGKGYADEEIRNIDMALSELSGMLNGKREDEPRKRKLTLTLSVASSLALIILLV